MLNHFDNTQSTREESFEKVRNALLAMEEGRLVREVMDAQAPQQARGGGTQVPGQALGGGMQVPGLDLGGGMQVPGQALGGGMQVPGPALGGDVGESGPAWGGTNEAMDTN